MTAAPRQVVFGTGEIIAGDARDPAVTTEVARGAEVVRQTLDPPYREWTAQWPLPAAGVLEQALADTLRAHRDG
jgi:hypothetical protein